MKDSEARRPVRAWARVLASWLSAIVREISDLARNANLCATVALGAFVTAWMLLDGLVVYDEVSSLNLGGWIGFSLCWLPWTLVCLIPLWILGCHSYCVYAVLGPLAICLETVQWFVRVNFKTRLAGWWIGVCLMSSPDETATFLGQYALDIVLFCLLPAAFAVFALFKVLSLIRHVNVTRRTLLAACVSFCLFLYGAGCHREGIRGLVRAASQQGAFNWAVDSIQSGSLLIKLSRMAHNPILPPTLRAADDRDVTGVFVLGESATRNHWGLYGYPRDTTPQLSAIRDELAVFSDLLTPEHSTPEAMRGIFSTRTLENYTDVRYAMPQALARCGFAVSLYSNQSRWNGWGSDEAFSFAGCDPFLIMKEQGETNRYDEVLLSYWDQALAKAVTRQVVFLHFSGSHTPPEDKCPPELAPFEVCTNDTATARHALSVDAYDNSIWYTDHLLGEIVRKLKALNKPAWMVYISDHGETPSAKSWRTATDLDLWEIPFVVWTSESFNAAFPERVAALRRAQSKPLQSDQLLYGLLRFMGVEGLGVTPQEDFLDDTFKPRRPRLIQSGQVPYSGRTR